MISSIFKPTARFVSKVKSDRVNALRKQYDSFLEEDKKRKERNDYILGKLDNIRYSSTAVQIRKPIVFGEVYPTYNRLPYRSDHRAIQVLPPEHLAHHQVDVPTKFIDDATLLKEISKKYILIPKLRPSLVNDYVDAFPPQTLPTAAQNYDPPKKDLINDDWKSKYDILEKLKNNENVEQADKLVKDDYEPVKEQALNINVARNHNNDFEFKSEVTPKYEDELPEKDFNYNGVEMKKAQEEIPVSREFDVKDRVINADEKLNGSLQVDPEDHTIVRDHSKEYEVDHKIPKVENDSGLINATAEYNNSDVAPQIMQNQYESQQGEITIPQSEHLQQEVFPEQDQFQQEHYSQEQYSEEHYPQEQYQQDQQPQQEQYQQGQEQYSQEQYQQEQYPQGQYQQGQEQYSQEQYQQEQYAQEQYQQEGYQTEYDNQIPVESDAVYPDAEKVYLEKDDYSPIEVLNPQQVEGTIKEQTLNETPNENVDTEYPVEVLNTEDYTPTEGVKLEDGVNVNPVYLASQDNTVPTYENTELEIGQEHTQQIDNSGIEAFDAEQQEMFYTEQNDAYAYDQQVTDGYKQEYAQNEAYQDNQAYYEGAEVQQQEYPVEINEHEETTARYDQNYEQQYTNQYDEQAYQPEGINYEAPLEAYEPSQQYEDYQYEQPDTVTAQNVEQELDREQGLSEGQNVESTENPAVEQTEKVAKQKA